MIGNIKDEWKSLQKCVIEYNREPDKLIEITELTVLGLLKPTDVSTIRSQKVIKKSIDLQELIEENLSQRIENKTAGSTTRETTRLRSRIITDVVFFTINLILSASQVNLRFPGKSRTKSYDVLEDMTKIINANLETNGLKEIDVQDILRYIRDRGRPVEAKEE